MAAIPRKKIIIRRRRLEGKQTRIKAMMEKLRQEEKKLGEILREREGMKQKIVGRIMLNRMEKDPRLKEWFGQEMNKQISKKKERDLFSLN